MQGSGFVAPSVVFPTGVDVVLNICRTDPAERTIRTLTKIGEKGMLDA